MSRAKATDVDGFVGRRVRMRRAQVSMSQTRLAKLLGVTFQQVQKYELGKNRIGAGRLYEIAGILGVPISYFYEGLYENERSVADVSTWQQLPHHARRDAIAFETAVRRIKDSVLRQHVLDLVDRLASDFGNPGARTP